MSSNGKVRSFLTVSANSCAKIVVADSSDGRGYLADFPDYFGPGVGLSMRVSRADLLAWRKVIDEALERDDNVGV